MEIAMGMSMAVSMSMGMRLGVSMCILVMAGQLEQRASEEGPCEEALLGGADP